MPTGFAGAAATIVLRSRQGEDHPMILLNSHAS